jgi:predicted metalloprotease with PDZ domain
MKSFRLRLYPALPLLLAALLSAGSASATIRYQVSLAEREAHIFRVRMTVPDVRSELVIQFPAWNALYQIRDFAHRVESLRATGEKNQPLRVTKLDKLTWRIAGSGDLTIEYGVLWDDAGPFASQLNANHAFLNLAMVLFYVPARRAEDVRIEYTEIPEGWRIAVALPSAGTPAAFRAANYDALVDAPTEIGQFEEWSFEAGKARIRVAVHGSNWDREKLTDSIGRIVAYQTALMRDVPFDEFLFLYHLNLGGGGGMEHANSTAISSGGSPEGVTAHEFFHLWNVKRIRPQSLEPVDYTKENWTRALWFAEGVTSTYGAYTMVRAGLWTPQQFYNDLAGEISTLESRPARLWQSVEQSSLDAWHERYGLYRRPSLSISYYNKGQLLGLLLDILIRDATDNRSSLDDVLRHLNDNFAKRGRFYNDSPDIRAAAEKVAGRSFDEFFARYVAGTDELPWAEMLARAGLLLKPPAGQERRYAIEEAPDATDKQRRIREGLLKGTTN